LFSYSIFKFSNNIYSVRHVICLYT